MNILHIGLASHFTETMLYQDNVLSDMNAKAGHRVTYISNTYMYKNGVLTKTEECDKILDNDVRLIRVNYDWVINGFLTRKIQKAKKVIKLLNEIHPDTILFHGAGGYELMDVAKYVNSKGIPFYIDSHASFKNTAQTPISKFAHKYINGYFLKKALPYVKKVLYVGMDEREFLKKMYYIPDEKIEYFPLGGILMDSKEKNNCRKKIIKKMNFPDNAIIFSHSGKMDKEKKTKDVLDAFSKVKDSRFRLLIFGSFSNEMDKILKPLITNDERVFFLGWKTAEEQREILGACDLYLQPGKCSATAQIALCNGCALLVNPDFYMGTDAFGDAVIYENNSVGVEKVLKKISKDKNFLIMMKNRGSKFAENHLDYKKLAVRYLK